MKINNSIVNFSLGISTGHNYKSIDEVPYWSLYSRPGDCVQDATGNQWRSAGPMSMLELTEMLNDTNMHRELNAYPRKSRKIQTSYQTLLSSGHIHSVDIIDKWNGDVIATVEFRHRLGREASGHLAITFLASYAPSNKSYYLRLAANKLFAEQIINLDVYKQYLPHTAKSK